MPRAFAVLALLLVLPLFAACSDSSTDSSSSPAETPYGSSGNPATPATPPLTQADIDKWYDIQLDMAKSKPKSNEERDAVLQRHGTSLADWISTADRLKEAQRAMARNQNPQLKEPVPPQLAADVELVTANKAKIEAGKSGRAMP